MFSSLMAISGWLPLSLSVLVLGSLAIFIIWSVFKVVAAIIDIIPFI